MEQHAFWVAYHRLFRTALESGVRFRLPSELPRPGAKLKAADIRRFRADCHRGYDSGQRYAVQLLKEIHSGTNDLRRREWQSLHVRKIVDGIAFTLIGMSTYVVRRLAYLDEVPGLDFNVIDSGLGEATRINRESRQVFALLADLSTCIHVADLLIIDFRQDRPVLKLKELKSGKVNEMLLEHLERYEPRREVLPQIVEDPRIPEKYQKQANRMMRQRIRLQDVHDILSTDEGIDPAHDMPIKLTSEFAYEEYYDEFIDGLGTRARQDGIAGGNVAWALHFGAGYSSDLQQAKRRAAFAVSQSLDQWHLELPDQVRAVEDEYSDHIDAAERTRISTIVWSNLKNPASRPFSTWRIDWDNREALVNEELVLAVAFDPIGFIALSRHLGLHMRFATRKKTAQLQQQYGGRLVPTWDNRAMEYERQDHYVTVLSGMISRFINDLSNPARFLREVLRVGMK